MTRALSSEQSPPATRTQQVQRHKEKLTEQRSEFTRIKNNIQQERVRMNLLTSVQTDIDMHRSRRNNNSNSSSNDANNNPGANEADYMLQERNRIDNSHSMADSILAQAYETREEFFRQRASLSGIQRRLQNTLSHFPGINTIIGKVNTRKKRDSLILASLITLCVLLLIFFR